MIACFFYKKIITRSLDNPTQALSAGAQRHLRACPDCRQSYELERELTRRLVADAQTHSQSPSPWLRGRIMVSLERPSQDAPAPRLLEPVWATALLLFALGIFSLYTLRSPQFSAPSNPPHLSANPSPLTGQTPGTAQIAPAPVVLDWSKALEQPLETEMKSVVSDARSAIHLLAQNFLPEPPDSWPR